MAEAWGSSSEDAPGLAGHGRGYAAGMVQYGYTLSSEEHPPADLVSNARRAEELGFDFVSVSDHYHPWVTAQGHSPFVWSVLGAVAASTDRLGVGIGVTCPIMRIHPAVIAQAAATTSHLLGERFFFGVGSGEALNEHILGDRWPRPEVRLAMLQEAIDIMRRLWSGDTVDFEGRFYEVENARLFDAPPNRIPLIVSGFGTGAAALAGKVGDGYFGHNPDRELIDQYRTAGGHGPMYAQLNLCWADDAAAARKTAHTTWPNAGISGQLSQDLPTWTHFEQAAEVLTEEQTTRSIPCGPDIVDSILDSVRSYHDVGYDHLYFHQIGPDQDGFFRFWTEKLRPALGSLA
jgi:G6PDH family F420-dependent oxidoreductase